MVEVNVYVINGTITIEDVDRNVLHRMTGFNNGTRAKVIIEALADMYVVLDVYD